MKTHLIASLLSLALFVTVPTSCTEKAEPEPERNENVVKVTLMPMDGSNGSKVVNVIAGQISPEPSYTPSQKRGYTFAGWFMDEEATEPFDFSTTIINEDLTLYAGYSRDIVLVDKGKVARVTGASLGGENFPNPNHTHEKWNLGGTDLGIIWEMSNGEYGVLFGDSYGYDFKPVGGGPGPASDWRSNVLAFSDNTDLENGLKFKSMLVSKSRPNRALPVIERENYYGFTYIPTAAIELEGKQYMHFMYWEVGTTVRADQNYSSIYCSEDYGQTWSSCRGKISFATDSYFAMVGYAKKPGDEYCYMLGAQSGRGYRQSVAKLARFKHSDILDKSKYEFWNGGKREWVKGKESNATTVLDGTVGELSVMYLEEYGRFLTLYFDSQKYAICYRSAARMQGPWSEERVLCSGYDPQYAQLYGSYIHPLSAKEGSNKIYWTISQWQPYNVFFMEADVKYATEN